MELNITHFFNTTTPRFYSASKVELGGNAGQITWDNACASSLDYQILDDEEKREAFRKHVKGFGAWSDEEIAAWNHIELNALLIQMISGDIREAGIDTNFPDWEEYEASENAGRLFKGIDGEIYYYIGD